MSDQLSFEATKQADFDHTLSDIQRTAMKAWAVVHPPPDDYQGTLEEWARKHMPNRVLETAEMLDMVIANAFPMRSRRK